MSEEVPENVEPKEAVENIEPVEIEESVEPVEVDKAPKKKRKGRPRKIPIPIYFEKPALGDGTTLEIQKLEAQHWLMGTGPFEETGKSFSGKVTYQGPRSFMSRQIILAKRSIAPNKGNWKTFVGSARLRQNIEFQGNIKDPQFLLDALTTQGGKANYSIRFVEDSPLDTGEEKSRFLTRDKSRVLALPYRLRKDQIQMGIKVPLNPGEAAQIFSELSAEGLPKVAKHIEQYLNQVMEEEKRLKKEQQKKKKN